DELSFPRPFRFCGLQFSVPRRPAGGDPRPSSPACGFPKQRAASLAPPRLRPALVRYVVPFLGRLAARSAPGSPRRGPPLAPPSQTWRTFLTNHLAQTVAIDFFTMPTATFRVLFVFVVLSHERRRVVPKKGTLPVLENLRWRVVKGHLELTATDLDNSLHISMPYAAAAITNSVDVLVPAKELYQAVKTESAPNMEIRIHDGKLEV